MMIVYAHDLGGSVLHKTTRDRTRRDILNFFNKFVFFFVTKVDRL